MQDRLDVTKADLKKQIQMQELQIRILCRNQESPKT